MTSNKPYVVIRLAQRGGLCEPRLEPEEPTPRNRYDVGFFSRIPAQSIGLDPLRLHDIATIAAVERTEALDLRESSLRMRRNDTPLVTNGENVKVVQELMRHASTRFTLEIYSQAQLIAKRVEAILPEGVADSPPSIVVATAAP
jgi:hypothetical protein